MIPTLLFPRRGTEQQALADCDQAIPCEKQQDPASRGMREFIHEAFDHENVVSWSDAAPPRRPDTGGLDPDIVDVDIGQCIGRLGRRFYGIEIVASED